MSDDGDQWVAVVSGIRSYDLAALALTASRAEGMAQLLGTYLAHRYNNTRGYAHPSQDRIAFDLKRSERAVRNMLTELLKTGEWYVVSGRGGTRSSLTMWSASRYYPTYDWLMRCLDQLRRTGAVSTANRIASQSTVFEVNETGARRATSLTLSVSLPEDYVDETLAVDEVGKDTDELSPAPSVPTILKGVLSDAEIDSFMSTSAEDRQRALNECASFLREGYDLKATVDAARLSARIRPTRYNGGVANWLVSFALKRGVRASQVVDSGAWADPAVNDSKGGRKW